MPDSANGHLSASEIMSLGEGGPVLDGESLRKHLDECELCRAELAEWKDSLALFSCLHAPPAAGPSADCPPIESLVDADDEAVLIHAASCDHCGPLLREFALSRQLRTASSKWQTDFARRNRKASRAGWMAIAASLVLAAGGALWWWQQHNSRPEVLLARAFTISRPFEYRLLPDAGYSAQDTRRSAGTSSFDKPTELLRAEEEIRRRLAARPDDAQTLVLKGLAELEERDYEAAIESLTHASDITPPDTRALVALGCAYLMRGDVEKRAIDYGHALDLLLKAVQQSPQDRAALFNLAIAYEKLRLLDEAADTWQKLLALPADGWSAEARTRLESVEKLRRARQKAEGAVMQDPAAFIAHRSAGFRPERYFEIFWMYWLPQAAMRADAHQACAMVAAELEARNGDTSLRDALAAVRPGKVSQALAQLAETMIDIRAGRSDDALPIARSALPVLEANGQFTAAARLRAEMVYIDRVQQRYADCLRDADLDSTRIRRFTYPYIAAQLQLEHGSCVSISDLGAARAEFSIAERSLADHQLWRQRLRATGFIIDGDGFTGNHQIVWQNAVSGLDVFWRSDASLFQAEQLQAEMEGSAAALGWYHAAAAIYAAAVHSVALAGNRSLEATCRIDRSRLLEKIGDTAGEMREVEAAERLFRSLPNGPETAYRFTFGRLRRAEAEIDNGHPAQALAALNAVSPAAVPPNIRANMEQARGLAYFAQSDLSAAAPCFEHAVALGGPSGSHQGLAQVRLLQGSVSAALAAWQGSFPDFPNAAADTPTPLLALALLPRGLAVFSKIGSSVHARMVSAPVDEVERTCSRFVRLCSSPDSDERELHAVGRRIYQWLLAPELEGFGPGGLVFMQADGWIAALPFAAFTPRGYFIEQVEGRSPPALRAGQPLLSESPALLVSVPSARAPGGARLPFLSAAQGETADLRASLSRAALLTGDSASPEALRAALPHAAIFHFAGHGWSDAGNGALVLAPGADGEARYLTAHEIAAQDWSGCRLAVLSACLTAAGELRGPINNHSLVRALLRAGAQQVVAAKWSISSEATRPLMKEFYSQLSRGVSAPEALNRAELSLSSQERWGHPYYWAAFEVFSR